MYVIYTLKNGKKIQGFLWNDVIEAALSHKPHFHDSISIYEINDGNVGCERRVDVYKDGNYLYFNCYDERVGIMDFDTYTVDELIEKLGKNDPNITDFTIYATLVNDTENVAIYDRRQIPNSVFLGFGRNYGSLRDAKYAEVLCLPTERRRKKSNWSYKIELTPVSAEDKLIYGVSEKYFEDFCASIISGHCRIVNRNSISKVKTLGKVK